MFEEEKLGIKLAPVYDKPVYDKNEDKQKSLAQAITWISSAVEQIETGETEEAKMLLEDSLVKLRNLEDQ